jgi:hypothetical protein
MKRSMWILLGAVVTVMLVAAALIAQGEIPKSKEFDQARAALREGKAKSPHYTCCVKPGCDMCPLAANMCPCAKNLAEGKPVCGECKMGWMAGHGQLQGIKPEDVKMGDMEMGKKMRQMRVMMEPKEK